MRKVTLVSVSPLALLVGLLITLNGAPARAGVSTVEPARDIVIPNAVLCVNPGGTGGCYASVQAAVDGAQPGDEIWVSTGVYTGVQGRLAPPGYNGPPVITQVVYLSKTVTIRGGYSPGFTQTNPVSYPTTLDAQGLGRVMLIAGQISPTVEGLRLTGGDATGLTGSPVTRDAGGGLYVYTATVTVSGCVIYSNTADTATIGHGGGLYLNRSDAILRDSQFISNVASTGDMGFGGGLYLYQSFAILQSNEVANNTASTAADGYGGGLYLWSSPATLQGNEVAGNVASTAGDGAGGGLYLYQSAATLQSNAVQGNTGSTSHWGFGGGLSLSQSPATLQGNQVTGNTAGVIDVGYGGGLYAGHSNDLQLENNTIANNVASLNTAGYGEGYGGGLCFNNSQFGLDHNTITGNTASASGPGYGGGAHVYHSTFTLDSSVVQGNTASLEPAMGVGGGLHIQNGSLFTLTNNVLQNVANGEGSGLWLEGAQASPIVGRSLHTSLVGNQEESGVYLGDYVTLALTNSILVSHTTAITVAANSTATLEATLWHANGANTGGAGTILTGTVNVYGNPAFAGGGDYHLIDGSAAIDQGVDAGVTTDVDGDPRPFGPAPDLGADEYVPCYPLTGLSIAGPASGHPGVYTFTTSYQPPTATLPIDYLWDDEGTLSTTVRDLDAGVHTLTVTATNCQGAAVIATHIITVETPCQPLVGVEITGPVSGHPGTYTFTASYQPPTVTLPIDYSWDDGGTLSTTVRDLDVGTHTLTVTATNCQDTVVTATHTITISAPPPTCPVPLAGVIIAGPVTGTTGTPYAFTASPLPPTATQPITYTWMPTPDDGQGTNLVTYTWSVTGSHTLTVSAANCGGPVTDTHTITLSAPPPPCYGLAGVEIAGPTQLVVGTSARYTAVITPGTASLPITYTWSPEPEAGQGTALATYHWGAVGTYWITLTVENCGGPISVTFDVVVEPMMVYLPVVMKQVPATPISDPPDTCPGYEAQVGQSYRQNFDHENDNDWYAFDVVSGHTYALETSDLGPDADTILSLYGSDCETMLAENDDCVPNEPASGSCIQWTATETGSLAVLVENYEWDLIGDGTGYTIGITEQ